MQEFTLGVRFDSKLPNLSGKFSRFICPFSLQVAHFVTPFNYTTLDSIHAALNGLLPQDIRVREIGAAVPEFHARFSCRSKVYRYQIYSDTFMDPFQRHFAYHTAYKLNACKMREAAQHFVGKHDFSAFANATREDGVPDPLKTISRFDVIEMVKIRPAVVWFLASSIQHKSYQINLK